MRSLRLDVPVGVVAPVFAAAALTFTGEIARADWKVVDLHPLFNTFTSVAYGGSGAQEVGNVFSTAGSHATIWNGNANSRIDLHPASVPGTGSSLVAAATTGQQVGSLALGSPLQWHASMWAGTADSWVDLNPVSAISSKGTGVRDGQQVGYAYFGSGSGTPHAGIWNGTADSWVDLNPVGASSSFAYAVEGGRQAGQVDGHAAMWAGAANSWVDLNPAGAESSTILAMSGGVQVGNAMIGGRLHAGIWHGTADSWIDMDLGYDSSTVNGAYGDMQVGSMTNGFYTNALLWSGTPYSAIDLSQYIPNGMFPVLYTDSVATGIWSDGQFVYISGYVAHFGNRQALMWIKAIPSPSAAWLLGASALCLRRRRVTAKS